MDSPEKSAGESTIRHIQGGFIRSFKYVETRLDRRDGSIQQLVDNREKMKFHQNEYKRLQVIHNENVRIFVEAMNAESEYEPDWNDSPTKKEEDTLSDHE